MADDVDEKVRAIFAELVGPRASSLAGGHHAGDAAQALASALLEEHSVQRANDIAFHLVDWNSDAAFVVAAILFPERFSPDELREGVRGFLIHAPNHIAAAAKLGGWPVRDIFNVDALSEEAPSN